MSGFIKSDYCEECEGTGRIFVGMEVGFDPIKMEQFDKDIFEQCFSCEELHDKEVRADRMFDELKELFI